MPIDNIFGTTINLLGKSMDLRIRNHSLISGNLANAETPGFAPKVLSFDNELQEAVKAKGSQRGTPPKTHPAHFPLLNGGGDIAAIEGRVVETAASTPGKDGNSVELEKEMGRMAENQILYNASVQILTKKFEGMKYAIKGGN